MKRPTNPLERALSRISVTADGCWEYPSVNHNGYGVIGEGPRSGRTLRVHRLVYEALRGPIPDGLVIDHLCRNRACCNPDHLEPVEFAENVRRGIRKTQQTECAQGHPLSGDNLRVTDRQRVCRTCERARSRDYMRRRRAAMKGEAA